MTAMVGKIVVSDFSSDMKKLRMERIGHGLACVVGIVYGMTLVFGWTLWTIVLLTICFPGFEKFLEHL